MFTKLLFFILIPLSLLARYDYMSTLDKVYTQDEFRIYYTLQGDNALPLKNQSDLNKNSIPDYIENIANQLSQASWLLTKDFHFTHPLQQERFKHKAKFVDIHIIPIKVNGAASDVVDEEREAIVMKLSVNLVSYTLTPLHEFFHLIQYGYSMFNNRWSMEGQARWVEYSFRKGIGKNKVLPKTIQELDALTATIYEADIFWNRLAFLSNKNKSTFYPTKLYKYEHSNKSFIKDDSLYGVDMIRSILQEYSKYEKIVAKRYSYKNFDWTEKQQKSIQNNPYIFLAIQDALGRLNSKDNEIRDFIKLIDFYISTKGIKNEKF